MPILRYPNYQAFKYTVLTLLSRMKFVVLRGICRIRISGIFVYTALFFFQPCRVPFFDYSVQFSTIVYNCRYTFVQFGLPYILVNSRLLGVKGYLFCLISSRCRNHIFPPLGIKRKVTENKYR